MHWLYKEHSSIYTSFHILTTYRPTVPLQFTTRASLIGYSIFLKMYMKIGNTEL